MGLEPNIPGVSRFPDWYWESKKRQSQHGKMQGLALARVKNGKCQARFRGWWEIPVNALRLVSSAEPCQPQYSRPRVLKTGDHLQAQRNLSGDGFSF